MWTTYKHNIKTSTDTLTGTASEAMNSNFIAIGDNFDNVAYTTGATFTGNISFGSATVGSDGHGGLNFKDNTNSITNISSGFLTCAGGLVTSFIQPHLFTALEFQLGGYQLNTDSGTILDDGSGNMTVGALTINNYQGLNLNYNTLWTGGLYSSGSIYADGSGGVSFNDTNYKAMTWNTNNGGLTLDGGMLTINNGDSFEIFYNGSTGYTVTSDGDLTLQSGGSIITYAGNTLDDGSGNLSAGTLYAPTVTGLVLSAGQPAFSTQYTSIPPHYEGGLYTGPLTANAPIILQWTVNGSTQTINTSTNGSGSVSATFTDGTAVSFSSNVIYAISNSSYTGTFKGTYVTGTPTTGNIFTYGGSIQLGSGSITGSGSNLAFGIGKLSLAGNLTTSGAYATTLTATAATSVTLPTTGTLVSTTPTAELDITPVSSVGAGYYIQLTGGATTTGNNGGAITLTGGAGGTGYSGGYISLKPGAGPTNGYIVLKTAGGTSRLTANDTGVGLYANTPVAQATTSGSSATIATNSGTTVNQSTTYDGYTIQQVVKALRNIGILT